MSSIDLAEAAKAIIELYDRFDAGECGTIGDWVEELQDNYPELAAAVFKVANNDE